MFGVLPEIASDQGISMRKRVGWLRDKKDACETSPITWVRNFDWIDWLTWRSIFPNLTLNTPKSCFDIAARQALNYQHLLKWCRYTEFEREHFELISIHSPLSLKYMCGVMIPGLPGKLHFPHGCLHCASAVQRICLHWWSVNLCIVSLSPNNCITTSMYNRITTSMYSGHCQTNWFTSWKGVPWGSLTVFFHPNQQQINCMHHMEAELEWTCVSMSP